MSNYTNVKVTHGSTTITTGATADIVDDASEAKLWGSGDWRLTKGEMYLLSAGGLLDWTGDFTGNGEGTRASPYILTVADEARRAGHHHHRE